MQALHAPVDPWQDRVDQAREIDFSMKEIRRSQQAIFTYPGKGLIGNMHVEDTLYPQYWNGNADTTFGGESEVIGPHYGKRLVCGSTPFNTAWHGMAWH